jgi:myo-inositol-1(or 4)-monophosphatase
LDGTVNFAHGIPLFSVSIAAVADNEVLASCVFQPMTQELFWAEKGQGAYLNGNKLNVTANTSLDNAILSTGFPYNVNEDPLHCIETFSKMARKGIPLRRLGSAAIDLAYVAAGRFDAFWEVSLQPWDFAGGKLLVEEAGGKVTQYDGKPCDLFKATTILATNGLLHPVMQKEIQ